MIRMRLNHATSVTIIHTLKAGRLDEWHMMHYTAEHVDMDAHDSDAIDRGGAAGGARTPTGSSL